LGTPKCFAQGSVWISQPSPSLIENGSETLWLTRSRNCSYTPCCIPDLRVAKDTQIHVFNEFGEGNMP
jgi:hypothetical protein